MSKRTIEETITNEFSFDNSNEQLRKKIKLLNENIIERIKEIDDEIDINEHEVHKFLLIFHSLFENVTSEETFEETDGRVVRRMVVRRQTLYPSTRRRREY